MKGNGWSEWSTQSLDVIAMIENPQSMVLARVVGEALGGNVVIGGSGDKSKYYDGSHVIQARTRKSADGAPQLQLRVIAKSESN